MAYRSYEEQRIVDPSLRVVTDLPFNAETRFDAHLEHVTPNELFYVRNHFPAPVIDADTWSLSVEGEVERPLSLAYGDLLGLPTSDVLVTLECAGNGRTAFIPPVPGERWDMAAASTALWTGVPLRDVLAQAGVREDATEILFAGADHGPVADVPGDLRFERSLPIETAQHPDTLLALRMNGQPLPVDHGFPVRLIVPGWYGMASVKWLVQIRAVAEPFRGFYQWDRYVVRLPDTTDEPAPLREAQVRAVFVDPANGSSGIAPPITVRGLAWSGAAPVERVEVQVDDGPWLAADLLDDQHRYAWRRWRWNWQSASPGAHTLRCRATDLAGNTQPDAAVWNVHGYSNNAIQTVEVEVE